MTMRPKNEREYRYLAMKPSSVKLNSARPSLASGLDCVVGPYGPVDENERETCQEGSPFGKPVTACTKYSSEAGGWGSCASSVSMRRDGCRKSQNVRKPDTSELNPRSIQKNPTALR